MVPAVPLWTLNFVPSCSQKILALRLSSGVDIEFHRLFKMVCLCQLQADRNWFGQLVQPLIGRALSPWRSGLAEWKTQHPDSWLRLSGCHFWQAGPVPPALQCDVRWHDPPEKTP